MRGAFKENVAGDDDKSHKQELVHCLASWTICIVQLGNLYDATVRQFLKSCATLLVKDA
jgi:hypothetical protein